MTQDMPNVEGIYEEIVEWLDTSNFIKGVQHVSSHGRDNFGLFSLVEDSLSAKGRWTMNFKVKWHNNVYLAEEEVATSHLIRF